MSCVVLLSIHTTRTAELEVYKNNLMPMYHILLKCKLFHIGFFLTKCNVLQIAKHSRDLLLQLVKFFGPCHCLS